MYHIAGNFWREKFLEISEKTDDFQIYISKHSLFLYYFYIRDGSLEVPHAKATQYNNNLFGKNFISLLNNSAEYRFNQCHICICPDFSSTQGVISFTVSAHIDNTTLEGICYPCRDHP